MAVSDAATASAPVAEDPRQPTLEVAEIVRRLPGSGEVSQRGVEHPPPPFGEAPCQGEADRRSPGPGDTHVELVLRGAQQDPGVGPKVAEQVHLVTPPPYGSE